MASPEFPSPAESVSEEVISGKVVELRDLRGTDELTMHVLQGRGCKRPCPRAHSLPISRWC